jgi:WD40 repeat protein
MELKADSKQKEGKSAATNVQKPPPALPDPAMNLTNIIGYSSKYMGNVKWTRFASKLANYPASFTAGSSHYLFYASGTSLVGYNPVTGAQQPHLGHCHDVTALTISQDGRFVATGQAGSSPRVVIWDLNTITQPKAITVPLLRELKSLSFNVAGNLLLTAGLDAKGRDLIIIWDILTAPEPEIVAKQISSFDISTIQFSPTHDLRLISCGKENIRFWRIKNGFIPGASVVLNQHARTSHFTCLEFNSVGEGPEAVSQILAGSKNGNLFVIGEESKVIEDVFQLHQDAITVISATTGYVLTGSADKSVKVWPSDLSEAYLEVKFKASISAIDLAPDALSAVIGVANGTIHLLDMNT